MRFRASASALCVLALALPACSAADAESDDELATQADALGPWMAHKEVVASPHPTQGAPAWADDGAAVLGVELRYERQLQGSSSSPTARPRLSPSHRAGRRGR